MTDTHLATFDADLAAATTPDEAYLAMDKLVRATVGVNLFTVMEMDLEAMEARRTFTSDEDKYPVTGTKEITKDRWYNHVVTEEKTFVANTLEDIATVFPDAKLVGSMGLGSVVNIPVRENGRLIATVNISDAEHHYTPERVAFCENELSGPAARMMKRVTELQA